MPDNYGTWGTETGLLDDYDFVIEHAQFATDARYNDGATLLLQLEGTATTEDGETIEGHTVMVPCGSGWESRDGGATAVHPAGKTKFNRSSFLGKIVDRCIKDFGIADVLMPRGEPTQAKTWEGLAFHFQRETISFGSGVGDKEREMPSAFLGADGQVKATTAAGSNGGGAAANPAVIEAKIKALAKAAANYTAFVDAVIEQYPEVVDDDALMARVVDDAGIWAEAHA